MRRAFASALIAGLLVAGCGDDSVTGGGPSGGSGGSDEGGAGGAGTGGDPVTSGGGGQGPEGGQPQGGEGGGTPNPECGDGNQDAGEECDDGNLIDGDDCDSNCTPTGCGNEVVTAGEACDDGNDVNGDECDNNCTVPGCGNGIMRGSEECDDSNLVDGDGCDSNCTETACGNNIATAGEECDDGNAVEGDGCDSNCTNTACGNNIISPAETCDDGNLVDGDGCDSNCTDTACGNGVVTAGEACDDGNLIDGDGCTSTCTSECGNSVLDASEICDADELGVGTCVSEGFLGGTLSCSATCTYVTTGCNNCGNGTLDAGEDCDTGNIVSGDGCSSICQFEITEIEPNEDGTPQTGGSGTGGNDFNATAVTNANNNGAFNVAGGDVNILGVIATAGDEDVFAITNTTAASASVRLDVWNLAPTFGFGAACGTSIDTGLNVRDAAGVIIISNDDRNGAADRCSAVTFTLAAGATVYAHLVEFGDNAAIPAPGYALQIRFTPVLAPVCGDGVAAAGEQCDDDNLINGDGCSATCTIEGATVEVEPNGTTAEADANAVQLTGDALVTGSITDVTDEVDTFRLVLATDQVVRFETFSGLNNCAAGFTTTLRVRDAAGVQLTSGGTDSTSGIASCSSIVRFLTAGTYYVSVEETGTNASLPAYILQVALQTSGGTETEPNETSAAANANVTSGDDVYVFGGHPDAADLDVYSITVPAGASIRAEIVEGGTENCEGNDVDSFLTLRAPDGTTSLVTDDDEGRGFCSLIDGTGTVALDNGAHNLAAGTYFIEVDSSSFASATQAVFDYRLVVTVRVP